MSAAAAVLRGVTCGELLATRSRPVVIIDSTSTIADACKILATNAVSSAPVYCKQDHSFWGFFDYYDVTELILKAFDTDNDHLSASLSLNTFLAHHSLKSAPAALVAELAQKHPFNPVHENDTLFSILPRLLEGVHRVPVTDSSGAFIGVVSQSDVAKVLYDNKEKLPGFLSKKLPDLNLARKQVVTVAARATVLDAIRKMHEENVSSVPIVDDDLIIMVLTLSDLKRMFKDDLLRDLKLTCEAYKASIIRSRIFEENRPDDTAPYFGVPPNSRLETVVGKMVATRAHRIFVVEQHKPVGVVTLTDIITALSAA